MTEFEEKLLESLENISTSILSLNDTLDKVIEGDCVNGYHLHIRDY